MDTVTGIANFHYRGETFKTWYRVVGDLKNGKRPLIALHGGPGMSHDYILPHTKLHELYGLPVIFYDQIGIGQSTHLPSKPKEFWTSELFMDELENLLRFLGISEDFDLLGSSWGGMLGIEWAAKRRPEGLKRLVLVGSPASMELWAEAQDSLIERLDESVRNALRKHEKEGTTDHPDYQAGMLVFYKKHANRLDTWPEELMRSVASTEEDHTVYHTMNGPSEFCISGSIKTWSVIDLLSTVEYPVLIINGEHDMAQDTAILPYFKLLPKSSFNNLVSEASAVALDPYQALRQNQTLEMIKDRSTVVQPLMAAGQSFDVGVIIWARATDEEEVDWTHTEEQTTIWLSAIHGNFRRRRFNSGSRVVSVGGSFIAVDDSLGFVPIHSEIPFRQLQLSDISSATMNYSIPGKYLLDRQRPARPPGSRMKNIISPELKASFHILPTSSDAKPPGNFGFGVDTVADDAISYLSFVAPITKRLKTANPCYNATGVIKGYAGPWTTSQHIVTHTHIQNVRETEIMNYNLFNASHVALKQRNNSGVGAGTLEVPKKCDLLDVDDGVENRVGLAIGI
ncbi:hypothetical protein D9757_007865 [Collybiopsis confluens]|uniref:AB hydrolase-1 domain-containing protein n=1 Tax=Collybiopsis confluens TaxID=2823264 RepID=A0A8H5HDH6_9AGAR|nr:hypothetical protein D9757_007865 [Collybiopsis confluens]